MKIFLSKGAAFAALLISVLAGPACGPSGGTNYTTAYRNTPDANLLPPETRIRGISFSAPRHVVGPDVFEPVTATGADWVAVVPYAYVDPANSEVVFDRKRQFWGETSGGVAQTIEYAHKSGLSVLVKPHLWVRGQGWPGEFAPTGDGLDRFLADYREYILRFARVAAASEAEMFSIGTELDLVAASSPLFFRDLISDVRAIYSGPITYAANWDAYRNVEFWDDLDYVGIDAYFPLVDSDSPSVEVLEEAWIPWLNDVQSFVTGTNKQILFTEFGYRSIDGAGGRQWELPSERSSEGRPNEVAQAAAYEALFRVWWGRPWFAGGFAWKWLAGDPAGRRAHLDGAAKGGRTDYTPQGKLAETVLATWYGGDAVAPIPPVLLSVPGLNSPSSE